MTLTPNPRVRVRVKLGKVRKPYPNFQMVLLSMTLVTSYPHFKVTIYSTSDNSQTVQDRAIVTMAD